MKLRNFMLILTKFLDGFYILNNRLLYFKLFLIPLNWLILAFN